MNAKTSVIVFFLVTNIILGQNDVGSYQRNKFDGITVSSVLGNKLPEKVIMYVPRNYFIFPFTEAHSQDNVEDNKYNLWLGKKMNLSSQTYLAITDKREIQKLFNAMDIMPCVGRQEIGQTGIDPIITSVPTRDWLYPITTNGDLFAVLILNYKEYQKIIVNTGVLNVDGWLFELDYENRQPEYYFNLSDEIKNQDTTRTQIFL